MKNPNFKKTLLVQTHGSMTYGIENFDGMTEQEIIDACDPNNFGGHVYGSLCKVFIDWKEGIKMEYWDNDFDRVFDEAIDELERKAKEKRDISDPVKLIGAQ